MANIMSRELLIRLPEPLYRSLKKMCSAEYKSMSAFVRELLNERIEKTLSFEDLKDIQSARRELQDGKTVSWRSVKRD